MNGRLTGRSAANSVSRQLVRKEVCECVCARMRASGVMIISFSAHTCNMQNDARRRRAGEKEAFQEYIKMEAYYGETAQTIWVEFCPVDENVCAHVFPSNSVQHLENAMREGSIDAIREVQQKRRTHFTRIAAP